MAEALAETESKPTSQAFADYLYSLSKRASKDGTARARLARLRRTLGRRGVDPMAYREIGPALGRLGVPPNAHETYLIVAALYALHAAKSETPWFGSYVGTDDNFGASCGRLKGRSVSMDLRFAALLDARREDLPYRLRQAVALLASHSAGVGVRYDRLIDDLLRWTAPGRTVQRQWAAAYWT